LEVKVRLGRVRVKGIWRLWVEVESEEKRRMNGKEKKGRKKWLRRTKRKMSRILRRPRRRHREKKEEIGRREKGRIGKESQKTRQRNLLFWNVE